MLCRGWLGRAIQRTVVIHSLPALLPGSQDLTVSDKAGLTSFASLLIVKHEQLLVCRLRMLSCKRAHVHMNAIQHTGILQWWSASISDTQGTINRAQASAMLNAKRGVPTSRPVPHYTFN